MPRATPRLAFTFASFWMLLATGAIAQEAPIPPQAKPTVKSGTTVKSQPTKPEKAAEKADDEEPAPLPAEDTAEAAEALPAGPAPGAAAGQTYLLRYKISKGDVLRWEISHQVDFDTTVNGTTQRAKTYSKSTKVWRVTDVQPGGKFTFQHIVEDSAMWQELTGRARVEWDSKKDATVPSGYESIAASLGKPLYLVEMDTQGKLLQKISQKPGKPVEEEDLGDDDSQMTLPLPKDAVPLGFAWHFPFDIKLPVDGGGVKIYKAREKFQLMTVKDGVATVSIETQVLTPVRDPAVESQLIQRGGRGEVKFDIAKGRVVSQQVDVDKSVVGFRGPASSIHYVSRFTERLLDGEKKTASNAKTAKAAE